MRAGLFVTTLVVLTTPSLLAQEVALAGAPDTVTRTLEEGMSPPPAPGRGISWFRWERMSGDWQGIRPFFEESGVTLEAGLISDWSTLVRRGGHYEAGRSLIQAGITIDGKAFAGLDGFVASFSGYEFSGTDASGPAGSVQGFSNIDGSFSPRITELWAQQTLGDDRVRIKIGQVDANTEFAYVENGGEFINPSMGISPAASFALPTYPRPRMSANVFVRPASWLQLGAGVYDAPQDDRQHWVAVFGPASQRFSVAEADFLWTLGGHPGRLGLGAWHHGADFTRFDGTTAHGTDGAYLVLDHELAASGDTASPASLGGFLQVGMAGREVSEVGLHVGSGLSWTRPFGAADDVAGAGLTYVRVNRAKSQTGEVSVELFYRWQATPWVAFKPDVQFLLSPAASANRSDVVASTLRCELTF